MFGLVRPTTALAHTGQAEPQRWDPWAEMARMREDMDEFVTRAFGYTPLGRLWETPATSTPVELYETPEQFLLRAHLPGLSREDINLEATAEKVTLWGERRPQIPERAKARLCTVPFGGFRFEYALPVQIQPDSVQAVYRDGILEVALPKVESARPHAVKVEIAS